MDEPETPAARQARHFAWLRRTGDLTMQLAEAYGAAALAECAPSSKSDADPQPQPQPARRSARGQDFLRAAAAVRQIIALELRVEAGPAVRRTAQGVKPTPPPDPRRPLLQKVLHDAVRNDPNRARRRREIDENIEKELLADPGGAEPIAEILGNISDRLHVEIDVARVPDAFLEYDEPIPTQARKPYS